MQKGSSGSHGSSKTIAPRAEPAAVETAPPLREAVGLARAVLAVVVADERVEI
jgi:hypothetical protein